MARADKPLVWLHGEIRTPPLSRSARIEAGYLLGLPHSRPMPAIGKRCHELRIVDADSTWRVMYRLDRDAVVIAEVFAKKTANTPGAIIENCRRRFREYDDASGEA